MRFLSEASFWVPQSLVESGWTEHAPFAFWLADQHRPGVFVELGTHRGYSYFAFNQAFRKLQTKTRCFAVDTWLGDSHAGFYGNEIFEQASAYNDANFGDFSEFIRRTFDDAAGLFADGSIDLLHIDGRHFYGDVKHDFETWRPKLSRRGIVLFHDTNVLSRDFGVHKLWEELKHEYRQFEFLHGHGLGVLGAGSDLPEALNELFEASLDPQVSSEIRVFYTRLGEGASDLSKLVRQPHDVKSLTAERDQLTAELHSARGDLNGVKAGLEKATAELAIERDTRLKRDGENQAITAQLLEQSAQRQQLADELEALRTHLASREAASEDLANTVARLTGQLEGVQIEVDKDRDRLIAAFESRIKALEADLHRIRAERDEIRERVHEMLNREQPPEIAAPAPALEELRSHLKLARMRNENLLIKYEESLREIAGLHSKLSAVQTKQEEANAERAHLNRELTLCREEFLKAVSSRSWQITRPLRTLSSASKKLVKSR